MLANSKTGGFAFLQTVARFSVAPFINFFLGIVAVVFLTRLFSPELYGAWNLFNLAANVCVGIVYMGLSEGILRFAYSLPEGYSIQNFLWKCIFIAGIFFLFFSGVVLCFYDVISVWLFHEISLYRITLLLIYTFSLMLMNCFFVSYFRVMSLSFSYTVQQVGVQFFSKIFIMLAVFIGMTVDTVLTLNTFGVVFVFLFCLFMNGKHILPQQLEKGRVDLSDAIKFSLLSWPNGLLSRVSLFLMPFVLSHQLGAYEVGLYASTSIFVAVITVLNTGFMTYWVSFVYKNAETKQSLIIKTHTYMIICIFLVFSMMIISQHGIYFLIGSDYQISRVFFSLVISDVFFSVLEATTQQGIALEKKPYETFIILFVSLLVQFVCAWYLTKNMGVVGAAFATMISAGCRFLLFTWRGQKYYQSIERWDKTVVGMLMILSLAVSNWFFSDAYWIELGIVFLIGCVIFLVFRMDILHAKAAVYEYKRMRKT